MAKFNIGDRVKVTHKHPVGDSLAFNGQEGNIRAYTPTDYSHWPNRFPGYWYYLEVKENTGNIQLRVAIWEDELTLVKAKNSNKNKTNMSSIIDKIKLARMSEPEKTLIKADLMTLDGSLTSEGKSALEDLLIQANKEALKTNYALPILADREADKN